MTPAFEVVLLRGCHFALIKKKEGDRTRFSPPLILSFVIIVTNNIIPPSNLSSCRCPQEEEPCP